MYSENGEDRLVVAFCEKYKIKPTPFVVDVGALDGSFFSNSRLLIEDCGWGGLLIEPDQKQLDKAYSLHKERRNVHYSNTAIASWRGYGNFVISETLGHSHLADVKSAPTVLIDTLSGVLNEKFGKIPEIGLLSIDAEGMDTEILKSVPDLMPEFVIVESNAPKERFEQSKILFEADYSLIGCKMANTVWVRNDLIPLDKTVII